MSSVRHIYIDFSIDGLKVQDALPWSQQSRIHMKADDSIESSRRVFWHMLIHVDQGFQQPA